MTDNPEGIVKDPVCGMAKPKSEMKEQTAYKGEIYYFCSKMDKDMFLVHPEHWVSAEEREKFRKGKI